MGPRSKASERLRKKGTSSMLPPCVDPYAVMLAIRLTCIRNAMKTTQTDKVLAQGFILNRPMDPTISRMPQTTSTPRITVMTGKDSLRAPENTQKR